jgi:hypothetical protein
LIIEPLSKLHNRKSFDSGDREVNRFLHEQALQDDEKDMSRSMVLVDEASPSRIIGYHTLAIQYVRQEDIPGDKPRIKRPIPVILLGQLGVDTTFHGRRFGELLLMDAQARTEEVSKRTGVRAMMLDARTERLAAWYERHDFVRLPGQLRMFKSIGAIRKLALAEFS